MSKSSLKAKELYKFLAKDMALIRGLVGNKDCDFTHLPGTLGRVLSKNQCL